jgi:hypothetical protein
MKSPPQDLTDTMVTIDLDDAQLAQLDELIATNSTPSHRLTREEMLRRLIEMGCEQMEKGESLLPYLDDEEAPASGRAVKPRKS